MPGIRLTAVWKYNPTIGQAFCNTKSINRKMQIDLQTQNGKPVLVKAPAQCFCHLGRLRQFVHPNSGHIKTTDPNLVRDPELTALFGCGTQFRLRNLKPTGEGEGLSRWEIRRAHEAMRRGISSFATDVK